MPVVRIVSNAKLSKFHVTQIQKLGSLLNYQSEHSIWVENSDCLSQDDVFLVTVVVEKNDREHPEFFNFCDAIAEYLSKRIGKSTQVLTSSEPILSVCWRPTKEGARKYGQADEG